MLEKIGRAAEKAAAGVPRRHFLGRLARGAALVAGSLGGILLTAGPAAAQKGGGGVWCCLHYSEESQRYLCHKGRCTPDERRFGWHTQRCSNWPGVCPLEP